MKTIKQTALLTIEAIYLMALFACALFLDSEHAVSLSWQYYLIMPFLGLLIALPSLLSPQRKTAALLFLSFNLALLVLPFTTFKVSKSFIQFHRQIKTGMTTNEVQHLFNARFPANGKFPRPVWRWEDKSMLQYMMDPTHARVDSVFVYFQDGRVIKTEYMFD
jgi:hypothetical protein